MNLDSMIMLITDFDNNKKEIVINTLNCDKGTV